MSTQVKGRPIILLATRCELNLGQVTLNEMYFVNRLVSIIVLAAY